MPDVNYSEIGIFKASECCTSKLTSFSEIFLLLILKDRGGKVGLV